MPKKELVNLLEFVTDLKPESSIPSGLRNFQCMKDHLKELSEIKGRTGKELQLRVYWQSKGHFLIQTSEGK
eukprot:8953509-Prorocentrum_lima.AAC.1